MMPMGDTSKIFFCYKCNKIFKIFKLPSNSVNQGPIKCDSCNGEFIEQMYLNEEGNQNYQNIGSNSSNQANSSVSNSSYNLNGRPINPNSSAYNAFRDFFGPTGNFNLSFNRNLNPSPNLNPNMNQHPSSHNQQRPNFNNPYANFGTNQNLNNLFGLGINPFDQFFYEPNMFNPNNTNLNNFNEESYGKEEFKNNNYNFNDPYHNFNELIQSLEQLGRMRRQNRHHQNESVPNYGNFHNLNDFFQVLLGGMQQPHTIPTSQNVLTGLQTVKLDDAKLKSLKEKGESKCSICVTEMNVGEEAIFLPCFHAFHDACIKPWLNQNHICPVCRFELPT